MDDIPTIIAFVTCLTIAILLPLVDRPQKPMDCNKPDSKN
jgi:hypothetical protein